MVVSASANYPLIPDNCALLYRRVGIGKVWVAAPSGDHLKRQIPLSTFVASQNLTQSQSEEVGGYEESGFLWQENADTWRVKLVCAVNPTKVRVWLKFETSVKDRSTGQVIDKARGKSPLRISPPRRCL